MTTRLPRITEVSPLSEGALHVEAISWPTTPPGEAAQAGPTRRVLPCGRFRQASRSRPIGLASAKCAACVRRACDLRAGCGHTACNRPTCDRPTCGREGRIRSSARTGRGHNPLPGSHRDQAAGSCFGQLPRATIPETLCPPDEGRAAIRETLCRNGSRGLRSLSALCPPDEGRAAISEGGRASIRDTLGRNSYDP